MTASSCAAHSARTSAVGRAREAVMKFGFVLPIWRLMAGFTCSGEDPRTRVVGPTRVTRADVVTAARAREPTV